MLGEAAVARTHAVPGDDARRHAVRLFAVRAGTSPRTLVLVRHDQRDVYEHLARCFAHVRGVEVRLDQRVNRSVPPDGTERRRSRAVFNAFGVALIQGSG
jgi:hypothetical protein